MFLLTNKNIISHYNEKIYFLGKTHFLNSFDVKIFSSYIKFLNYITKLLRFLIYYKLNILSLSFLFLINIL